MTGALSTGPRGDRVEIIVQHGARIFQVVTDKTGYDFDWCERDQCHYYHDSGDRSAYQLGPFVERPSPGEVTVYAPDSVEFTDGNGVARSRRELSEMYGYTFVDAPALDPFDVGTEARVEFCEVCRDDLPEDNYCDHLVEDGGIVYGCGSTEVSADEHKEQFLAVVARLGCKSDLIAALTEPGASLDVRESSPMIGRSDITLRLNGTDYGDKVWELVEEDEDNRIGLAWIWSLEPGVTTAAISTTLDWLTQEPEKA